MSKQTSVEWLYSELSKNHISNDSIKSRIDKEAEIWKQAKAMEKEQIIQSNRDGVDMVVDKKPFVTGEQYYNETYGGDK
jgi:predicted O-linked N-acetylglucosamine transferase (SPINDLY family)